MTPEMAKALQKSRHSIGKTSAFVDEDPWLHQPRLFVTVKSEHLIAVGIRKPPFNPIIDSAASTEALSWPANVEQQRLLGE